MTKLPCDEKAESAKKTEEIFAQELQSVSPSRTCQQSTKQSVLLLLWHEFYQSLHQRVIFNQELFLQ